MVARWANWFVGGVQGPFDGLGAEDAGYGAALMKESLTGVMR